MPDIQITSITLEKTSIAPGDKIVYEVCIENIGDEGDIDLYAGFGYQDGNITYIGNGYGHGYWIETIGSVSAGESLCPTGQVEMPPEALALQTQGKDIRFFASAIPGSSMSQDVTVTSPPPCTQQFRLEDQNGNPLSGSLTGEDLPEVITVPESGEISIFLTENKQYMISAFVGALKVDKTFTACIGKIIFQFITVEQCTQQLRFEDQNGNSVSGTLTITDKDFDVSGDISLFLESGKEYTAIAVVDGVTKQSEFTACTSKIIFQFTVEQPVKPTLTTTITSQEPYISGTNIEIKTALKSPSGEPIQGKKVSFYTKTELLGVDFTNANGEVLISFNTGSTPATYEIYTTHLTDDSIFIESNHVIFTTEEPVTEMCWQDFRLTDQDDNMISGIITIGGKDYQVTNTGEISIQLTKGQSYIAVVSVGTLIKQHTFIACTSQLLFKFIIGEYATTSLSISIDPTNIGPGQDADITGKLTIQGKDQILPGIPVKLYCDKGEGYQFISSPTTPTSGTGIVTYHYVAQNNDVGKTLKFKYNYDGSDTLKQNPSESEVAELTVSSEPILTETITTLTVSPTEIKPGNTLILISKITEKVSGNTLPVGTFVHFYIGDVNLGISGTVSDGYAYSQFKVPADYIGSYICKAKYDGIVNKYGSSESTFNINVNPECVEHESEQACTDAECHWWSDNTCKGYAEPPPAATGSIGFIIRPNSRYGGNIEQAVTDLTSKSNEITSAVTKYFTSFVDIEFVSIDIYHDKNIDRVILKIYYKETGTKTMVIPLVTLVPLAIGAIAAIFVVTAVVGWIESWFADDDSDHPTEVPEDELIDAGQGGIDGAEDDAAGNVYVIDDETASALNDCLNASKTADDIAECYGLAKIPEENNTDANAETFGIAKLTAALAVLYTLCESLQEQIYCDKAEELDKTLNTTLTQFRAGTITKEQFLLTITHQLNTIDDFLEQKEEDAKEEREVYSTDHCFITNPGYPITSDNPCIITKTQALLGGTVIGMGIVGFFILRGR